MSLISDNLNTQLVSAMFYPLENQIRRIFRLDGFSINTGFIQNLFSEYSNDPDKLAQYMDLEHLMSDIAQFSSTILLNNLSISASKYLARMVYLEYTLGLQEATDLKAHQHPWSPTYISEDVFAQTTQAGLHLQI